MWRNQVFFVTMSFLCSVAAFLLIRVKLKIWNLSKSQQTLTLWVQATTLFYNFTKYNWSDKEKWISKGILWHRSRKLWPTKNWLMMSRGHETGSRLSQIHAWDTAGRHWCLLDRHPLSHVQETLLQTDHSCHARDQFWQLSPSCGIALVWNLPKLGHHGQLLRREQRENASTCHN